MGFLDRLRGKDDGARAIEAYNLGLAAKYKGEWKESLAQNQRANELRPGDEATIWNLGIAATALSRWDEARKAWLAYGIEVKDGPGEVSFGNFTACVRLNPSGAAEVVWGTRIDPARMRIDNVPLASSERRYGDVVLIDGAQEGTRVSNGNEFPVFDELGLWKMSAHSTFEVELTLRDALSLDSVEEKCRESDMWVEDWGTVRNLCMACSRGNPGEHACTDEPTGRKKFGFAAKSEAALREMLRAWAELEDGVVVGSVTLVVQGVND